MEVVTPKSMRRCTRLRVEIPLTVTSLDRLHPFVAECTALVVSPQGAGLEAPQALPIGTPVILNGLPGGASASARIASCVPLGKDEKRFLIGTSLYNPGNVWGVTQPPEDWECAAAASAPAAAAGVATAAGEGSKGVWPYNVFSGHTAAHPKRR
ncbi:MAG: hypothetical protein WA824_05130 [Candidatus Sulfotelmatobacter sp.]